MASPINFPPAPPPPPPAVPGNDILLKTEMEPGETETKEVKKDEFILQMSTLLDARLADNLIPGNDEVLLCIVMPLKRAIRQVGPMCGIVALAEALELMKACNFCEDLPKKIMGAAKEKKMTKQGEMFSVSDMKTLAECFGACRHSEILNLSDEIDLQNKCFKRILQSLLMGFPVLFPYDVDRNHSPAMRKGHGAHWAVVHGIASRISKSKTLGLQEQTKLFKALKSSPDQLILQPLPQSCCNGGGDSDMHIDYANQLVGLFDYESSFAIAHQGKSFHTGLWEFKTLCESNLNLKEIDPKIIANQSEYIFDNIIDGLCSKVLLLKF